MRCEWIWSASRFGGADFCKFAAGCSASSNNNNNNGANLRRAGNKPKKPKKPSGGKWASLVRLRRIHETNNLLPLGHVASHK